MKLDVMKWLQAKREKLLAMMNFDQNICCLLMVNRAQGLFQPMYSNIPIVDNVLSMTD